MSDYVIFTDSSCDLTADTLKEWNIPCVELMFRNDATGDEYTQKEMGIKEFYSQMRSGVVFKTAAANMKAALFIRP